MTLDPELFDVHEKDGLRLIIPARNGSVANAPWSKETVMYRSRVETLEGLVVSQGFGKFFNLATGPDGLRVELDDLIKATEKSDAIATLKIDGSLLIRSVYNGKIMLRTRGSFGYEFLDNADEIDLFRAKYPLVFDPSLFVGYSLLFEWVSPRNVIVLKYPEPNIILIGGVQHTPDLPYLTFAHSQLDFIAKRLNVPLVTSFDLTSEGWAELHANLESNQEIEGYVIRLHNEQVLVKVKCAPYLTKHGLKSTLTTEKLIDMWFQQGSPDYQAFCATFLASFDEETFMWTLGAISSLFDGIRTLTKIMNHMGGKVEVRKNWPRKEAALAGLAEYGQTKRFSAYMNLWEGKQPSFDLLKSLLLQNTKQVEIEMFKATGPAILGD